MKARVLVLMAAISPFAMAQDSQQWHINPMIGYQWLDTDERQLDDDGLLGLGLEYQFNEQWGAELKYLVSSLDEEDGFPGNDADLDQIILEGMYYLNDFSSQTFKPYLAAGIGSADFDYDIGSSDRDTLLLAGAGFRYLFNDRWSSKTDLRLVGNDDDAGLEGMVTLAISYAFGKASPRPAPAPEAPAAPADRDQDGVPDSRDRCPNSPRGAQVDAQGCELDSDGDGVVNSKDQCPNTSAGARVDEKGCALKLTRTESLSIDITFASNSAVVTEAFMNEVEKVARFMKSYPTSKGVIEGHTDNTGKAAYNQSLSQKRADAVAALLITRFGIAADRLQAKGYGEDRPVASNDTQAGRQKNRRVVAVFNAEVTE